MVTDAVATWYFTTESSANENLRREGVPESRIHFVGNVMIDTLLSCRERAARSLILETLGLGNGSGDPAPYGVVTLHRPSNVDDLEQLARLVGALREIAADLRLVFPVHPRTSSALERLGRNQGSDGLHLVEPLGYLDFLQLMAHARVVITDSGGIQEETTILQVPCLTVREHHRAPCHRPLRLEPVGRHQTRIACGSVSGCCSRRHAARPQASLLGREGQSADPGRAPGCCDYRPTLPCRFPGMSISITSLVDWRPWRLGGSKVEFVLNRTRRKRSAVRFRLAACC